ncbi:MAG: SRPBCC family protein, partial [Planctomycetota bacterium]
SERIDAPVERVFAVATDLPTAAERIDGIDKIELLTDGPVGVGTQWKETRGKSGTETLEVSAFDAPNGYTVSCDSCGCHFDSRFRFEPLEGGGTRATLDVTTTAESLMAKLMAPLTRLMMGGMKKAVAQDLADIKRAAEAG